MSKVTVVGAGNVGATCANVLAFNEVADEVVLLDIKEGVAEGKALDMMQTATLLGFDTRITGVTNDYTKTAGSDVVVITSGIPRNDSRRIDRCKCRDCKIGCSKCISTLTQRNHYLRKQSYGHYDLFDSENFGTS